MKLATWSVPLIVLAGLLMAGCSTTDVYTPPSSIPSAGNQPQPPGSLPQTQTLSAPVSPVTQMPPQNTFEAQTAAMDQPMTSGRPGPGAPPTTLDEQAAKLGNGPVTSQPLNGTVQPGEGMQQQVAQSQSPVQAQMPSQTPGQTPAKAQPVANAAPAMAANGSTLRFLPIIGAPVQAVTPLSRQLGQEARARGLVIKPSSDASSQFALKGYFSAYADGSSNIITYVWDILDASGNRVNRLQGQENAGPATADPWANIQPAVMQKIATHTIDLYVTWLSSRHAP